MQERNHRRRSLNGEAFEVAIIGGGINGVALARECAAAGRRTLLVEQHDFASGTTSRSTRIIHGGLRYLEHGEIGLVRESLREREKLLRSRPHLVRPMRFLLALPPGGRNAWQVRLGLWLYRRFAPHSVLSNNGRDIAAMERLMDAGKHWSVSQYDDAQCEFPERLVAEWLTDARAAGAESRNYTEALRVEVTSGRVHGLRLRDRLDGSECRVTAKWVINASGPWADRVARDSGIGGAPMVGGVRGSHIVLPRFTGAPDSALYTEALDGRPMFVIPWNEQLLVGTTEIADAGDPAQVRPSAEEFEYLVHSLRRLFPAAAVRRQDIQYAMAGVRPLPFSPGAPMAAITRRHLLHDHASEGAAGMISIIGGKLTTAAGVARECARAIGIEAGEPRLDTVLDYAALKSATQQWTTQVGTSGRLAAVTARALVNWFGRAALEIAHSASEQRLRTPICDHSPHLVAEAVYAVRKECAVTLGDILLRRVPVALAGDWTPEHTRQAAPRIGAAMGWSEERVVEEMEAFEDEREQFLIKPMLPVALGKVRTS